MVFDRATVYFFISEIINITIDIDMLNNVSSILIQRIYPLEKLGLRRGIFVISFILAMV